MAAMTRHHKTTRRRAYNRRLSTAAELHRRTFSPAEAAAVDRDLARLVPDEPAIAPETELERWARDGNR